MFSASTYPEAPVGLGPAPESAPGAAPEPEKRYAMKAGLEVFPLDSSSSQQKFVARAGEDKSYVIPEQLKNVLVLFDGTRTVREVAEAFSAQQGVPVEGRRVEETALRLFKSYGLVEEVAEQAGGDGAEAARSDAPPATSKSRSFEFVFRAPLISPRLARPITDRLTWLFRPAAVVPAVALIVLTQVALLGGWFSRPTKIPLGLSDLLLYYLLVVGTAAVHEFGHATACRRYGCEHGAIGFLLYLIFPSFYVNLSNAWRLSGRQRAVVDVGGIYFQLLATVPLYLFHVLTGNVHCAVAVYSVNVMVLFSLNPVLKFDGYWLLVDLSGLVNLRARAWGVVKEVVRWGLGKGQGLPTLREVSGRGKRLLLVTYSFLSVGLVTSFILFLVVFTPARVGSLAAGASELAGALGEGAEPAVLAFGKLLFNVFFLLFIYKLLSGAVLKLFGGKGRGERR